MRSLHLSAALLAALSVGSAFAAVQYQAIPKTAAAPADNPTTPAKVELGKMLFFDPRLSANGTISCNSCHNLMSGGDDSLPSSVGVHGQVGKRSAPSVWNSAFLSTMFWDGRAASLEEQAKGPMTNPIEMGMPSHDLVVARLREVPGYVERFQAVFGKDGGLTIDNAAKAIAAFERTLLTPDSPFDRYVKGDKHALTADAQRGLKLVEEVGCTSCHQGVGFAGPELSMGTGFFQKFPTFASAYDSKYRLTEDGGRFEATKKEEDRGLWRVPTWRNVAVTAPYFHNGSVKTLDEAVRVMAKAQLNRDLPDADVRAIVAFLGSLTGEFPKLTMPRLPATVNRSTDVVN